MQLRKNSLCLICLHYVECVWFILMLNMLLFKFKTVFYVHCLCLCYCHLYVELAQSAPSLIACDQMHQMPTATATHNYAQSSTVPHDSYSLVVDTLGQGQQYSTQVVHAVSLLLLFDYCNAAILTLNLLFDNHLVC